MVPGFEEGGYDCWWVTTAKKGVTNNLAKTQREKRINYFLALLAAWREKLQLYGWKPDTKPNTAARLERIKYQQPRLKLLRPTD